MSLNSKNLKKHIERKHQPIHLVSSTYHLPTQCVDKKNGIYVVAKSFRGPCIPMLQYALYVILGGTFDFSESDIPSIRRWWSVLLLEKFPPRSVMEIQQRKRRRTDKPHKTVATVDQPLNIQELPPLVLREILLEVVLQDGDVAIGSLALTCRCFNSIVSMESFC